MIHHQTLYIDKVVNNGMKLLYTFGIDCGLNENGELQDKAYVIKIWDFTQLVGDSCKSLQASYLLCRRRRRRAYGWHYLDQKP